jgi:hypothetical protein
MAAKIAPPPAGSPPHVVVFLIDDWGHNDLGFYNKNNENYIQSPFMDSKASSGLLMNNACECCVHFCSRGLLGGHVYAIFFNESTFRCVCRCATDLLVSLVGAMCSRGI